MIGRAYNNDSGRVLEHLFGAQPVAQNRTPVLSAIAAGLRKGQPQTSRPTQKSQLFGFRLLILTFLLSVGGNLPPDLLAFSGAPYGSRASAPLSVLYSVIYLGGDLILLTSLSELSITYSVQFVNYFFKNFLFLR